MAGRLNAKTAVITGSSRGIGKGIAQVFAAEGARVLIVGRDPRAGNAVVQEIRRTGGEAEFCPKPAYRAAGTARHPTPYLVPGALASLCFAFNRASA